LRDVSSRTGAILSGNRKEVQVSGKDDGTSGFVERSRFEWAPEDIVILPLGDEDEDDYEDEDDESEGDPEE
jgi:hypothetical protein